MKQLSRILAPVALVVALAGAAEAQNVRPLGRTSAEPNDGLTIQWPGSGFEARFEGKSFRATIDDYGDNWLNVEVDGVATRIDLDEGAHTYQLYSGPAGAHTIRVTRRTGSLFGPTRFVSLRADKLAKTEESPRRILVIGDSIASGFGVEGQDQTCKYTPETHNADLAYPSLLGKVFGADVQTIAVDGHGLTRNYAGDDDTMRTLAWRTLQDDKTPWPAASWKPEVIVVNLGTYDFSSGDPGDEFDAAYVTLLRKVRFAWPDAEIYGAIGSQLWGGTYKAAKASVFGATEAVQKAGDAKVHFLEFTPPSTGRRYGCDWHPGIDAQKYMAGQLQAAITQDLGWKPAPSASERIALSPPTGSRPPAAVSLRKRNN